MDPAAKLVDELCSLLDEATILSICSDYDLHDQNEFDAAREVLLSIAKDVEAEEATGFIPSGIGVNGIVDINDAAPEAVGEVSQTSEADLKSNDGLTTTTENSQPPSLVSGSSSKASTRDAHEPIHVGVFDDLSDEEKVVQLAEMFTSLKLIDVRLALKKVKGDASLAIDELLNIEWLEQSGQRVKGIDGFYTPDESAVTSSRKRKNKKKKKSALAARSAESSNSSSTNLVDQSSNSEEINRENITYLAERLNLAESEISSVYLSHGTSMGATVVEILDTYINLGITSADRGRFPGAEEQEKKYSWVPSHYVIPIFEITSPTRQYALDVIQILGEYFEKPAYLKFDVAYNVAASSPVQETFSQRDAVGSPGKSLAKGTSAAGKPLGFSHPTNLQSASRLSSALAASRDHSSSAATSAFRKGQSDPLFRQAAGFYAERAREQSRSQRQASSIEAGYLVDATRSADTIDLHGLTVQDGVDIAVDRVWRWWNGLGEDRARKARDGFTVVTGLGRHSADGKSRLRINVFKALVADGWKVEVLTGQYLVTGRRR